MAASKGSADSLFAFDLCKVYNLPDAKALVRNPRNGSQALLTRDVVRALEECQVFRSLDEHARYLQRRFPPMAGGQIEAIRQPLEAVLAQRLMLSPDVYAMLLAPAAPRPQQDSCVAVILTWERPEALVRVLDSLGANCNPARIERVYVVDDTRTPAIQDRNRATVTHFASGSPMPVIYLGAPEQAAFLANLCGQAPELAPSLKFLIDRQRWSAHWTSGLARTVALLVSVGKRLLMLDDDILCEVHEPFSEPRAVSFSHEGRDASFFGANEEWARFRAGKDTDPFARHLRLLGLPLPEALGAQGITGLDKDSFRSAELQFMESLSARSPVLVTECGSLGDPGTGDLNWLANLQEATRKRLLESQESVLRAMQQRNCWNGVARLGVRADGNMSQLTGVDNRAELPPYIPILRGEDRLFGHMVRYLFPDSVVLDLPWAVPHLPIPPREIDGGKARYQLGASFPNFFLDLVNEQPEPCRAKSLPRRYASLGRILENLSDLDDDQLLREYQHRALERLTQGYGDLKRLAAESTEAPPAWREFIEDAVTRMSQELVKTPFNPVLKGAPGNLEGKALCDWWRGFWQEFGQALQDWPAIRKLAAAHPP